MKSAITNNYNMTMSLTIFLGGRSDKGVAFNNFICIVVGSKNILWVESETKCTFYDEYEEGSMRSLFENHVE